MTEFYLQPVFIPGRMYPEVRWDAEKGSVFSSSVNFKTQPEVQVNGLFNEPLTLKQLPGMALEAHGAIMWKAVCNLFTLSDSGQGWVLSHFLQNSVDVNWKGADVIDLGTGTGIVGITLAKLGASVLLTDYKEELLDLVEENVRLNCPEASYDIQNLTWGTDISHFPKFPYIVGGDLLQYVECATDLVKTLEDLSDDNTTIFLANERRRPGLEVKFYQMLSKNFTFSILDPSSALPGFVKDPIFVVIAHLKTADKRGKEDLSARFADILKTSDWSVLFESVKRQECNP